MVPAPPADSAALAEEETPSNLLDGAQAQLRGCGSILFYASGRPEGLTERTVVRRGCPPSGLCRSTSASRAISSFQVATGVDVPCISACDNTQESYYAAWVARRPLSAVAARSNTDDEKTRNSLDLQHARLRGRHGCVHASLRGQRGQCRGMVLPVLRVLAPMLVV